LPFAATTVVLKSIAHASCLPGRHSHDSPLLYSFLTVACDAAAVWTVDRAESVLAGAWVWLDWARAIPAADRIDAVMSAITDRRTISLLLKANALLEFGTYREQYNRPPQCFSSDELNHLMDSGWRRLPGCRAAAVVSVMALDTS